MSRVGAPRTTRWLRLFTLGLAPIVLAAPGSAQLLQDQPTVVVPPPPPITMAHSMFARDRDTPVAERALPEFSAQGLELGNFRLYPGLAIGGLVTSNVYDDNDRKHSDVALVVRPEVTIRTSGGPYTVSAYAWGDIRRYASHGSENTEEAMGGVDASVAIGALSSISAGASYGSFIEPRFAGDSPANAAKPLEYNGLKGYLTGTLEGASTRVVVRGDVEQLRFRDTPSLDGGTLFTQDRDRTRYQEQVRVERALSPALSIYGAATLNQINYRLRPVDGNRDSSGFGLYVGSSFDLTHLMRGDIRVGYIRQNFDLARYKPISGFGAQADLIYFPNQLSTITLHAESSVQDSGVPGTTGYLHRGGSVRLDYELRRYFIVGLEGGYYRDSYRGISRDDDLPFVEASATYLSKSHWNARLGYRFIARHCDCSPGIPEFDDHRLTATLTFQY